MGTVIIKSREYLRLSYANCYTIYNKFNVTVICSSPFHFNDHMAYTPYIILEQYTYED